MTTFNRSYEAHPSTHRYNIGFKVTWEVHTMLQDISNEKGQNITNVCRELLDLGIESYRRKTVEVWEKPKLSLLHDLEMARDRKRTLEALAELRPGLNEEEFQTHCRGLGFEPGEIDEIVPPRGTKTKEERCGAFLRVLFTDRPEGLPGTRVLEIASQEGFGLNLTRSVATDMGIRFQSTKTSEGQVYIWKPPEIN